MLTHRVRGEGAYRAGALQRAPSMDRQKTTVNLKPRCPAWKELIHGKRGGVVALTYVRAAWRLRRYSGLADVKKTPHDFLLAESWGDKPVPGVGFEPT